MEAALDEAALLLWEWTANSIWAFLNNEGREREEGSNQNPRTRWAIPEAFFSPSTCEGHWLSAGTLFVMKLNPQSTVGQFVSAHRQEERGKGIVLRGVFWHQRNSALPWGLEGGPFLYRAEVDPVSTGLSILSQLQTNDKGDREQMEKLEAAAVPQSHTEWKRSQNLSPALTS